MRNARFSGLSILSFTIGLAVCIMIVMHIYNQFTFDFCYENHKRIYKIVDKEQKTSNIDINLSAFIAENFPDVEAVSPIQIIDESIKIKTTTNFVRFDGMASTNNDFFRVFSINVLQKMGNQPFVDNNSVVITQSVADALFGNDNPIGEMVTVDDDFETVVTAVIEDFPASSSLQANVFINSTDEEWMFYQTCQNNVCFHRYSHFILFNEHFDKDAFTEKLNASIINNFPAIGEVWLQELTSIYLSKPTEHSVNHHGSLGMVYLFIALAIIVLAISTINYLNFNILIKLSNLKEVGIRRIVGAKTKELVSYSFTEVCTYLLISLLISFLVVAQFISLANTTLNAKLSLSLFSNPAFIAIVAGLLIPVVFASALVPFLFLPRESALEYLSTRKGISGNLPLRSLLTTAQLAVSIVLFAVVIVISRQINFVKTSDLGFEKEHLVCITLPYNYENSLAFKQRLEQTTIHSGVSLSRGTPGFINHTYSDAIDNIPFQTQIIYVDFDFIKTMGMELLMGRDFIYGERGMRCIVNQEFFNRAQWDSHDNQFLWKDFYGGFEVIGVVENFNTASLYSTMEPVCLIIANSDEVKQRYGVEMNNLFNVNVRLTPGETGSKIRQLQNIWSEFIPDEPMDYFFYDTYFDSLYREEEALGKSLWVVSLIAILLTCLGLLGQIMHTAFARTKEIGIHKVNGAKIWQVMLMLNMDFVKWVAIAFIIATPIAWYAMSRWLQNFAYRTELSWWIFALAGLLALGIALLTVSWQSWLAARRNPVEALRYE